LRLCLLESLGGGGSASPAGASFILCTLEIGGTMLPPFVRDWTSLLQRHLRVDSRLLSQSFEHSAPSLVESVGDAHVPVLPQGRQRWKAGKAKTTVKQNCGNLLPPGLLHAAEFAIIAAARLVVMNLVMSDKHGRRVGCCEFVKEARKAPSFLLPCVLQCPHTSYIAEPVHIMPRPLPICVG
jgi:hypothetical protein